MSRPVAPLRSGIEVELPDQGVSQSLDFQMARWSPGRYAVFDFAKTSRKFTPVQESVRRNRVL